MRAQIADAAGRGRDAAQDISIVQRAAFRLQGTRDRAQPLVEVLGGQKVWSPAVVRVTISLSPLHVS
jgi:hypothetical protein